MALSAEFGVGTRAVLRPIEAGTEEVCPEDHGGCGGKVKFSAQVPLRYRRRVIANVYWRGSWNRMEVWHLPCYVAAGLPYGRLSELRIEEFIDLQSLLAEGIDPTDPEIISRMAVLSRARKDPTYRPAPAA